jgi:hypothetical protein
MYQHKIHSRSPFAVFLVLISIVVLGLLFANYFALLTSKPEVLGVVETSNGFRIRTDGILTKNGTPFYPFGFYYQNEVGNIYGNALANEVDKIGDAGFNVMSFVVTGPNDETDTAAARQVARDHGMYIIASYFKPSYQLWVNRLKTDSSILAWNTNDDFNYPYTSPTKTPTQAKTASDTLVNYALSVNYSTFSYGSGGGYPYASGIPYLFGAYSNSNDILAVQTYPISNTDDSFRNAPLEENIAYLKYSKAQVPANKPVWANTQSFAWDDGVYPNAIQTRNMTYAALVHRLQGILSYAYHDTSGNLATVAPNTWQEWKSLRADINGDFLKAVIDGSHTYIDSTPGAFGTPRVHAGTFEYTDIGAQKAYVYAVLINTNSQASVTVTNKINLPAAVETMTFSPLFPGDSRYYNSMVVGKSSGTNYLNGTMPASSVAVYKWEKSIATNPGGGSGIDVSNAWWK